MTLTLTNPTQAESVAILKAMSNGQQNVIQQGYNAYSKRQLCFWIKYPATKADAQALPEYVTEVAPGQFKLTEAGVQLYRAWLNQPLARPNADQQPQGYHGTRHARNWQVREAWEDKLSRTPLAKAERAAEQQPEAVEISDAPAEIETEPASDKVVEILHTPVSPTPPQPPTPPTPGVIQLDLTAFIQPLIAEIETLKAQLAAQTKAPAPRPVARRPRPSMPMQIVSRRGGAA